MEAWEIDFEWLRIRHFLKDVMEQKELPDLNSVLLLIGIRELGEAKMEWTKEEKVDLINIATSALLEMAGYYTFAGRDEDGWPHYREIKPFDISGSEKQEDWMKEKIVHYFKEKVFDDASAI